MYLLSCPQCGKMVEPKNTICPGCETDTSDFSSSYYKAIVDPSTKWNRILKILLIMWIVIIFMTKLWLDSRSEYRTPNIVLIALFAVYVLIVGGMILLMSIGAIWGFFSGILHTYQQRRSSKWVKTEAMVVASTEKEYYDEHHGSFSRPFIVYRFTIDRVDFINYVENSKWDKLGEYIPIRYYVPEINKLLKKQKNLSASQDHLKQDPVRVNRSKVLPGDEFLGYKGQIITSIVLSIVSMFVLILVIFLPVFLLTFLE